MTRSEKEAELVSLAEKFQKTADGLGKGIDVGIFDTVVALNALGFRTTQSCEGHTNRGIAAPWIDISFAGSDEAQEKVSRAISIRQKAMANNPYRDLTHADKEAFREAQALEEEAEEPLFAEIRRLLELLSSFYLYRATPFTHRLIVRRFGGLRCRLESQVAVLQESGPTRNVELLPVLQHEMQDLGQFAREKFLASELDDD